MNMLLRFSALVLVAGTVFSAVAGEKSKKSQDKNNTKAQAPKKESAPATASAKPNILSAPIRKPATLDPNSTVEVRGQSRTLSMMLVLKNNKDGVNFIKVRDDYKAEIQSTDF